MATKTSSKTTKSPADTKAGTKSSKSTAKKTAAAAKSTAAKPVSTVIPFAPTAQDAFRKMEQTMRTSSTEFKPYISAMESLMSNYKDQYEKMSSDATGYMRQGLESYVQYGTSMMKGMEVFTKTYMELAQDSAERNANALKGLMACRTLNEATEAQNKLIQSNLDESMSAATKLSELAIKICTEACEPINQQMTKTMKKMSA